MNPYFCDWIAILPIITSVKEATPKSVIPKGCNFETTLLFSSGVRKKFKFNKKALGVETRTDAQGPFFFKI